MIQCNETQDPSGPGEGEYSSYSGPGVDHNCTLLSAIPQSWIENGQSDIKLLYAHTSHGGQLTEGLSRIERGDSFYSVAIGYSELPTETGALCIFDGQLGDTYIGPEMFWETAEGMNMTRAVLDQNQEINVCMWCWCGQLDYYGAGEVQNYLDAIEILRSEYPDVVFVYMTGNTQSEGEEGYNRSQCNNQIRAYCEDNNRTLYDFADIDCWYHGVQNTYSVQSAAIPSEHPQYHGEQAGHSTHESCKNKGVALWCLMALIAGWNG